MANRHRGEVEIMLDRKRIMKFGFLAVAEIEEGLDIDINDLFVDGTEANKKLSRLKTLIEILRACLYEDDDSLTYKDVGRFLDNVEDTNVISEKIFEAFKRSKYYDEEEEDTTTTKKKKKKVNGGTGKN